MENSENNGLVVRVTGHEVWVDVRGEVVPCVQRGRMRRGSLRIAAGDRVTVSPGAHPGDSWAIERIAPRNCWLSRYVERDNTERVIVANVARLFVVTSLHSPPVQPAFVDRVLASARWGQVESCIVLNKMDITPAGDAVAFTAIYESCGYQVLPTSAETEYGVDALAALLTADVYAFVGASGVGKSSLLNRLDPAFDLKTRDVGEKTGRGRHTTTYSQLYPFRGVYIADTPGMQTFGFPGHDSEDLAGCFPEMDPYRGQCRFHPCTHSHEPGCAVKEARDAGAIAPTRYESYLKLHAEIENRARRRKR